MSEPLYSVGQHVAVCSLALDFIIPQTTVVWRFWDKRPIAKIGGKPTKRGPAWAYRVAGSLELFDEECLRPINPDTEYLDQPESVEQPA